MSLVDTQAPGATPPAYAAKRSELAKQLGLGTALRTAERSTPEVPHLPIKTEEPTMPTPEAKHTATSVLPTKRQGGRTRNR